ncbi:MAG: hypothetical protein Q9185_004979 [Variospora sp. 1 TL-2023]
MPSVRVVRSAETFKAITYDDTTAAQPPIPVTVATPPPHAQIKGITGLEETKLSPEQQWLPRGLQLNLRDDNRRDSGLAPSNFTARDSRTTFSTDADSSQSLRKSPSLPQLSTPRDSVISNPPATKRCETPNNDTSSIPPVPQMPFIGLMTEIPTGSFDDLTLPGQIEFSTRGSMLIGGKKAHHGMSFIQARPVRSPNPSVHLAPPLSTAPKRVLSPDEEMLSSKVRWMYEDGTKKPSVSRDSLLPSYGNKEESNTQRPISPNSADIPSDSDDRTTRAMNSVDQRPSSPPTTRGILSVLREEKELAGGIEDWDNVDNADVDRYGFIIPSQPSHDSSLHSLRPKSRDPYRIQRVSTVLQLASEAPRRRRSGLARSPSSAKSPSRSTTAMSTPRPGSVSSRPASSQSSYRGTLDTTQSKLRFATNKLPYHRDRRCLDEAGDMLTLPPGLMESSEKQEDSRAVEASRLRERRREEKWQKMAQVVNRSGGEKVGGGMTFDFDTKSPKVIERTWKGIPDRWRATAWHAFLSASAKRRNEPLPSDDDLKAAFAHLLKQASPDDVQIDIDVPRTINCHIMFRRRYRGGQRLLFRVLHCLSIYFPDTGYVQGMAALAATLLCYYDEEMAFVMLVRLWQLRGLERLYQSGFNGLMQALDEFETRWLANGEVSAKLGELGIGPTAYGTRWYLTLFNYSIPFPAQLRVWDVFMLLGDPDHHHHSHAAEEPHPPPPPPSSLKNLPPLSTTITTPPTAPLPYNGTLDVLHAVSAALIDGTRDILLDADFENAMKVLTSWIPVRDEELLMRVAKAEWKLHRRRHKK